MLFDNTKFLLRWRFEYTDGRREKVGMWSQASNHLDGMAAFVTKENLGWAIIEAKDRNTRQVIPMVEVPGPDYFNFQWISESDFNVGSGVMQTRIIGLKVTTRNEVISAFNNGDVIVEPLLGGTDKIKLEQYRV